MSKVQNHTIRTIAIGTRVLVQGRFVCLCADGTILIRVGQRLFRGRPVDQHVAPPAAA